MQREDYAIVLIWVVIIIALVALIGFGFKVVIDAFGDILVAVISVIGIVIGGILTHALTELREQRASQQREMQRNYFNLLSNIDEIIRAPGPVSDEFAMIHLKSWVIGSPEAIRDTQSLMAAATPEDKKSKLTDLLRTMRKDIGLPEAEGLEVRNIFLKSSIGHLPD